MTTHTELPRAALRQKGAGRASRKRRDRPWLARIEYLAFRGFLAILSRMPLRAAYRLFEIALVTFLCVTLKYRLRGLASLEIAYGRERPLEWRRRILWDSVRHLAWFVVDALLAPKLLLDPRYRSRVDVTEVERVFRRDRILEEKGALIVSSHQGGSEIASLAAARDGWRHAVVARPFDNRYIWEFYLRQRRPFEREELPKARAVRQAWRILKNGGMVALLADQDSRGGGVFVPFFGTLAFTHTGPAALALLAGVPVYLVFCIRTRPRRFEYKVHCSGPLAFEPTGNHDEDVLRLTALITAEIERMARRFPEQVLWLHRRWKTRPPEEGGEGTRSQGEAGHAAVGV